MKRQDPQIAVDKFNKEFPVGTLVDLRKDSGEIVRTRTRSPAQVLSGHSAVVWLERVVGCYLLDRVTPAPPPSGGEGA